MARRARPPTWLFPTEFEVVAWTAAIPTKGGRGALQGGRLHLTSHRLVWRPIAAVVPVGDTGLMPLGSAEPWEVPLTRIARVGAVPGRRALLEVVTVEGRARRFLIGAGGFSPVWSRKNTVARDDAVHRIEGARTGAWRAADAGAGRTT
ncbi:MAG: hypothetical protein MUF83_03715 [Acidimicrobiales bacterium]|jgi:hypothetical protein|nr:hypothetical protein [Acidimicrobiales bacterium]